MESVNALKDRRSAVLKALECLRESLHIIQSDPGAKPYYKQIRNSAIQCFEFSIDTFWKFIKDYLFLMHNIVGPATPRAIFQKALDADIIDFQELEVLFEALVARNLTSHTYNEALAEKIFKQLPTFYKTFQSITDRLSI